MPLALSLCQVLIQLLFVQRMCCAGTDKTFYFSPRVWYYTDKRTCMKIFLYPCNRLDQTYFLHLDAANPVHYYIFSVM